MKEKKEEEEEGEDTGMKVHSDHQSRSRELNYAEESSRSISMRQFLKGSSSNKFIEFAMLFRDIKI